MEEKSDEVVKFVTWKEEHEKILIEWADKAMCYSWLHSKSYNLYKILDMWFTVPVIIVSTITGTANFAQDRIPLEYSDYYVMVIGALNILVGIVTTIKQFLKISELNEGHRVSSISWDKYYRNIRVELAKNPDERLPVEHFLKAAKEEFDRLMETSPNISSRIIRQFQKTFKPRQNVLMRVLCCCCNTRKLADIDLKEIEIQKFKEFHKIAKPDICDTLVSTNNFKYIDDTGKIKGNLSSIRKSIIDMEELKRVNDETNILEFIDNFTRINDRKPRLHELKEQFDGQISVEFLKNMMEEIYNKRVDDIEIDVNDI